MKGILIDETGNEYGKWKVLYRDTQKSKHSAVRWVCKCACGTITSVAGTSLRKGLSNSCGCNKGIDLVGERIGNLLVISRDSKGSKKWVCKCDCGNIVSIFGSSLRQGSPRNCGCAPNASAILIPIGTRFSHLVVTKMCNDRRVGQTFWECLCDCGKTVKAPGGDLRRGYRKKCGVDCSKYGHQPGDASFNVLFRNMKKSARERKYSWELTKEQVKEITSKNCFYCGTEPLQKPSGNLNGVYLYNGIDRVDNSIGYVFGNCVPCCGHCNVAKRSMTVKQFRKKIIEIYNHWASIS